MRYTAVSPQTDEPITLQPGVSPPPGTKYCYYPRIRCIDCPGKLYTPDSTLGMTNFEVHLRNRHHREKVLQRVQEEGPAPGGGEERAGTEEGELMDE
jgi:SWI/SNF-related matrix-associated actin-dependent regulator of chromatin subfamily B member 1